MNYQFHRGIGYVAFQIAWFAIATAGGAQAQEAQPADPRDAGLEELEKPPSAEVAPKDAPPALIADDPAQVTIEPPRAVPGACACATQMPPAPKQTKPRPPAKEKNSDPPVPPTDCELYLAQERCEWEKRVMQLERDNYELLRRIVDGRPDRKTGDTLSIVRVPKFAMMGECCPPHDHVCTESHPH